MFLILVATAVLTAFYMIRMWRITFFGKARSHEAEKAHEGGITMTLPLIVLAVLAVGAGYTGHEGEGLLYGHSFAGVWSQIPHAEGLGVYILSLAILGVGAGLAFALYKPSDSDALATKVPAAFAALTALKESFDMGYNWWIAKVQDRLAMLLNFIEQILLSGLIIRGLAGVVGLFGIGARALHTGSLHAYVYWFLLGAVALWGFAGGLF